MTPLQIARRKVISAALCYEGSQAFLDISEPGAFDDAQMELHEEMLDEAIGEYAQARAAELEGSDRG